MSDVIPAHLIERWWETLAKHRTEGGVCVVCKVRRCVPRADAFAALVVHDILLLDETMHERGNIDDVTTSRP